MTVITISRQYGSWGDEVAAHVGKLLGYRSFDKRLMAEVALESVVSAMPRIRTECTAIPSISRP